MQVTESFVETAVAMSKRILSQPNLMELLLAADEANACDNPFNSYTKLQVILNKTKSPRNLEWCLFALYLVTSIGEVDKHMKVIQIDVMKSST